MFPRPDFFAGARLNFAENLLFPHNADVDESSPALITVTEANTRGVCTSWARLREAVRRCSSGLRAAGVKEKDVVAGFISNSVEAAVALLAAASIGAIWTSISPDNGASAVLDRLAQIGPKVLFVDNATIYNGKEWPNLAKTLQVVDELKRNGLQTVILVRHVQQADLGLQDVQSTGVVAYEYDAFLEK